VGRDEPSWSVLNIEEKRQMGEVLEMWIKAANQGYAGAQFNLGVMSEQRDMVWLQKK
jgi:TPR repeat protein